MNIHIEYYISICGWVSIPLCVYKYVCVCVCVLLILLLQ